MSPLPVRYPEIHGTTLRLAISVLTGRPRSFREDARAFAARLKPSIRISGPLPGTDPPKNLILTNHYWRPGFRAWWIPLGISAALPIDVHWLMTAAWTFSDPIRSRLFTPATRRLFRRVSHVYGFTTMPPMPPRPWEAGLRADSVRSLLRQARHRDRFAVGLSPEGSDSQDGGLAKPPAGVGRFIALLAEAGLQPVAVGVFEEAGRLCLSFGAPFALPEASGTPRSDHDARVADRVMRAIAACLPARLRGEYAW